MADRWHVDPFAVRHHWPSDLVSRALQIITSELEAEEEEARAAEERAREEAQAARMGYLRRAANGNG